MNSYNDLLNRGTVDIGSLVRLAAVELGVAPDKVHVEYRLAFGNIMSQPTHEFIPYNVNTLYYMVSGFIPNGPIRFCLKSINYEVSQFLSGGQVNLREMWFDRLYCYSSYGGSFQVSYLEFTVI